ncbi:hypothetical protein V6N12_050580 [Hibiscus sabdariffa]|uniref:Uncharacterized protein n=1 Tax=Hibiscus sabdariffa TaxID=183260 RepID=A0ABR2GCV8_9ROSI
MGYLVSKRATVPLVDKGRIRFHEEGGSSSNIYDISDVGAGHVQEGDAILNDDQAINELFESDFADPGIGGSAIALPDATTSRNVVSPDTNTVLENKPVAADHDDSALDSGDVSNFEASAANIVVFVVDAVNGPMHPLIAEFSEWFDRNDDGADSMQRDSPHSLPIRACI